MVSALDIPLREELLMLRKKLVQLETAHTDSDRLRKEMTKLKIKMQEEKSKSELDFMNQLSEVIRGNSLKMQEMTGELQERNSENRALREQLVARDSRPKERGEGNQDLKHEHSEVSKLCQTQKFKENNLCEDENQVSRSTIQFLQKENNKMRTALEKNESIKCSNYDGCEKNHCATQIQNESRDLKNSSRNETSIEQTREFGISPSQSHTFSSRRQSARGMVEIHENNTSRIIQQLEKSLKTNGLKEKISFREIKKQTTNSKSRGIQISSLEAKVKKSEMERNDSYTPVSDCDKSMESHKIQISKLEAELLSTKKRLASEKEMSRKEIVDLNSKLTILQERLCNSESFRAALAVDKERLIAETNRIAKSKIQLEQKAKRQHQQLKQLQQAVDEKLYRVEINHQSDEIQHQCNRGHVESLKRELLLSQDHVRQLSKTLKEKEKAESGVEDLARNTIKSLDVQVKKLQEELTVKQMELYEVDRTYKKQINELKPIIESMHLELSENQKAGDVKIQKLRDLSEEKDTLSQRLEKEKEQLVLSMQDMMKNRRDEVDDLQNEILEMNIRLANETREISTLRSRLEESNHETKEITRLQEKVIDLSHKLASKKNIEHENSLLEKENRELRRKLEEASAERLMVEEKLQNNASNRGRGGSSKPVQVLRERNAALKFEVEKLTRKIEKMSEKISENS